MYSNLRTSLNVWVIESFIQSIHSKHSLRPNIIPYYKDGEKKQYMKSVVCPNSIKKKCPLKK